MKSNKHISKKIIGVLIFILLATFSLSFARNLATTKSIKSKVKVNAINVGVASPQNQPKTNGFPVRFKIPRINIDTKVEQVGLTTDGAVDVPSGPVNVAWFKDSPVPGDIGSAIIDGHSGYKNNKPAVFDNLYKVKIGDKIYVENNTGIKNTFVVRKLKTYKNNEIVPDVFVSNDNKAHLNLITCTGAWSTIARSHSDRLVVFADLLP